MAKDGNMLPEEEAKIAKMLEAACNELIDAIRSVQDWNGTYVGDCIEKLESFFLPAATCSALCSSCKKRPATDPHPCPFKEDIHNDGETLCDCCDECAHECSMDI